MDKLHGSKWWTRRMFNYYNYNNNYNYKKLLSRDYFTSNYSWCIPSRNMIKSIVSLRAPVLDVGAGSGYLSYLIELAGGKVTAIELKYGNKGVFKFSKNFYPIRRCIKPSTVINIVKSFNGTILLSWPNYLGSYAYEVAKECKVGNCLVYVGEGPNGCTADDRFFEYLDLNFKLKKSIGIPQWFGMHDSCEIYKKIK